jgi:hypothetical protein
MRADNPNGIYLSDSWLEPPDPPATCHQCDHDLDDCTCHDDDLDDE